MPSHNDSSVTNHHLTPGFEGPEKLLEIWFRPTKQGNLLNVSQETWVQMLKLVKCEILSTIVQENACAYLLSESSMFVYKHKLVLKTCGQTTLLKSLDFLLELVKKEAGLTEGMEYLFYSRKSFMFPDHQLYPHTGWNEEVDWLERYTKGGSAYVVGKTNGDHWYCYIWEEPKVMPSLPGSVPDCTFEVLMSDLNQERAKVFWKTKQPNADLKNETMKLIPGNTNLKIDDFLFEPCGYSCNGIDSQTGNYFNIHVTPEADCSYASFETNIFHTENPDYFLRLLENVMNFFQPGKCTVTLFMEKRHMEEWENSWLRLMPIKGNVAGFERRDKILYEFEKYDLLFLHFERPKHSQKHLE